MREVHRHPPLRAVSSSAKGRGLTPRSGRGSRAGAGERGSRVTGPVLGGVVATGPLPARAVPGKVPAALSLLVCPVAPSLPPAGPGRSSHVSPLRPRLPDDGPWHVRETAAVLQPAGPGLLSSSPLGPEPPQLPAWRRKQGSCRGRPWDELSVCNAPANISPSAHLCKHRVFLPAARQPRQGREGRGSPGTRCPPGRLAAPCADLVPQEAVPGFRFEEKPGLDRPLPWPCSGAAGGGQLQARGVPAAAGLRGEGGVTVPSGPTCG